MKCPVTLLCKNPSTNPERRLEQGLCCAEIEGYTNATAELSRFITKLFQEKNPNASLIYNILKPLIDKQNENYNKLCEELNQIEED